VENAREILATDPDVGVLDLARLVGVSPHHLSRTFRAHMGQSISRYRIRLRVQATLDRLADAHSLAELATDVGFADQAHLTRCVKTELGETPRRLQQLLKKGPRSAGSPESVGGAPSPPVRS
jgi:transcriptional regulator GlxA family with amidase domain